MVGWFFWLVGWLVGFFLVGFVFVDCLIGFGCWLPDSYHSVGSVLVKNKILEIAVRTFNDIRYAQKLAQSVKTHFVGVFNIEMLHKSGNLCLNNVKKFYLTVRASLFYNLLYIPSLYLELAYIKGKRSPWK